MVALFMANKRGRKPTNNKSSVKIDNKLNEKLNNYSGLTGSTKTDIVNTLLNDFFKNKIVSNDYITPPNLFYFNMKELNNKVTEATEIKPIKELENNYIIKKIPNNLDNFNKKYNSYCYENNKNIHRGILFYPNIVINNDLETWQTDIIKDINYLIFIFDYNAIENKLNIGLINFKDLNLYLDVSQQYIIKNYENERAIFEKILFNNPIEYEYINCFNLIMCCDNVITPFNSFKNMNDHIIANKKRFENLNIIINDLDKKEIKKERNIYNYDFTKAIFNNKYSLNNLI